MATEKRGSIAFFSTDRSPLPLDIFSCPLQPTSSEDELCITDKKSYNYNGQEIPSDALVKILKYTNLAFLGSQADVNSGSLSGMIFVSERENLELLHISLHYNDNPPRIRVYSLAEVFRKFPLVFGGVRMEDSGCFASDHLIYVSTKEPASERRQPWTAVYKTKLKGGRTDRLTPPGQADLNPSVSPCGKKIAVASFQGKGGWSGEVEDLKTDIFVMNIEKPYNRRLVVKNGGWPTWGSENIIFFHRRDPPMYGHWERTGYWGVYRADISSSGDITLMRVTPVNIDAFTPAAINATTVAVATQRQRRSVHQKDVPVEACRHIEIFYSTEKDPEQITQKTRPKADHFNPFVIRGEKCIRIGYHRCTRDEALHSAEDITRQFRTVTSPDPDIGLFRVGGGLPTFSKDGSRLAFVDKDFKTVYVLDKKDLASVKENNQALQIAYEMHSDSKDRIFSLVWSQNDILDALYLCVGRSLRPHARMNIIVLENVSRQEGQWKQLTRDFNNSFPSTNPQGTRLVFQSTREDGYSNLYIMEDTKTGLLEYGKLTRLTNGPWVDTQCQWSPSGKWIVFSSSRDKPYGAPEFDSGFDPGYFAVYLLDPDNMDVCVRVIGSRSDLGGHVSHPYFSPDGRSIVVSSDLAALSVDPISLFTFPHIARPDGNIFTVGIDATDIAKNRNVKMFNRITHSRYDDSGTWTSFSTLGTKEMRDLLEKIEEHKRHPLVHLLGGKKDGR